MEEITIGEYARTDNGLIGKYFINKNSFNVLKINEKEIGIDIENDIVKHSKNIIDIVELYDYVNYFPVFNIIEYENGKKELILATRTVLENQDIETILTHEQMENNCYRIGE